MINENLFNKKFSKGIDKDINMNNFDYKGQFLKESKTINTDQIFPYKTYHNELSYNENHLTSKENPNIKSEKENSDRKNSLVKKHQNISETFCEGN